LLTTLKQETAEMKKMVDHLTATANTLNQLAGIADAVTTTLKAILKFV
jgi:glycerol-3-phosphate dehydrogenase